MRYWSRLLIILMLGAGVLGRSGAQAAPALLADLDTGRVIYSEDATQIWYPASVTKLMTIYLAFKAVQSGKMKWTTPLVTSERAKSMPPSKIGMAVGQTLTLDAAVKILLVKSANDVAVIVAEALGGSVEGFAEQMNREAAAIGMVDSHFLNPHGLFIEGQHTTARDMAVLARRLMLEFPKYAGLFAIPAIQIHEKVMENTNGIIGRYEGATGMKTGFICSSGFNVVASAQRGNKRLIAVVFGMPSAAERTLKTMDLLDRGFGPSMQGPLLESLPRSANREPVDLRGTICGRKDVGETDQANDSQNQGANKPAPPVLPPREKAEPIIVTLGPSPKKAGSAADQGQKPAKKPAKAAPATQSKPQ
jgi:D-alanyl-D-alanine carboxypeptidase